MIVLVWFVVGALVGWAMLTVVAPVLQHGVLSRTNHRGAEVPTLGGVAPILATLAVAALVRVGTELAAAPPDRFVRTAIGSTAVMVTMLGFGLLGMLDDIVGVGEHGGFRGHLRALVRGRATTGAVKLFGGGLVAAVAVVGVRAPRGPAMLVVDVVIVALAANTANLFDRAPGRALKVILVTGSLVLWALRSNETDLGAVALGAGAACLVPDLRERMMLGDTGVNPLGAVVGLQVVTAAAVTTRVAVVVALLALNLAAERWSLSSVIRGNRVLHRLDVLGAPHRHTESGGPPTPPGALP